MNNFIINGFLNQLSKQAEDNFMDFLPNMDWGRATAGGPGGMLERAVDYYTPYLSDEAIAALERGTKGGPMGMAERAAEYWVPGSTDYLQGAYEKGTKGGPMGMADRAAEYWVPGSTDYLQGAYEKGTKGGLGGMLGRSARYWGEEAAPEISEFVRELLKKKQRPNQVQEF